MNAVGHLMKADEDVAKLENAIFEIIINSISCSKKYDYPLFGLRKMAYILGGSSNSFVTMNEFEKHPYWGSLAFLSVRKLESLLQQMLNDGVLEKIKSPHFELPVVDVKDKDNAASGLLNIFLGRKRENIDSNRILFLKLREARKSITENFPKSKFMISRYRKFMICNDETLNRICEHIPGSVEDFVSIKELERVHKYADVFVKVIEEHKSQRR